MELKFEKARVRIMVVDDEDAIRGMLVETLKEDGWDVNSAENGKLALEKLEEWPAHIILSDINMPELTGTELLEAVKTKNPSVEFIIMTSHATLETAVKAVQLGAYDYLNKPFEDLSVVPAKMAQVAERILLRQQNQELLKRLKNASLELKHLLSAVTPLNAILSLSGLREKIPEILSVAFGRDDLRSEWWIQSEDSWVCGEEKRSSIDEIKEKFAAKDNLKVGEFLFENKEIPKEFWIFESPKASISKILLQQVSVSYEKARIHEEIQGLANRDGLTRLYNHRYFQERLHQEFSLARRKNEPLSLLLLDIDHFKKYNDQNGHPAGDELLRRFSGLLNSLGGDASSQEGMRRMSDVVARYGGEEFVMLLPFTSHQGALIKAERIVEAIRETDFEHGDQQPLGLVSASIGVASYPEHAGSPSELVEMADKALYCAKEGGRNRFVSASELVDKVLEAAEPVAETLAQILDSQEERDSPSLDTPTFSQEAPSTDFDLGELMRDIEEAVDYSEPTEFEIEEEEVGSNG